jgi:hypothetical protein
VPLLARLPLVAAVRESGDAGQPIVAADPTHAVSRRFLDLAALVTTLVEGQEKPPAIGLSG